MARRWLTRHRHPKTGAWVLPTLVNKGGKCISSKQMKRDGWQAKLMHEGWGPGGAVPMEKAGQVACKPISPFVNMNRATSGGTTGKTLYCNFQSWVLFCSASHLEEGRYELTR